jgi:hypothetical protein
MGDMKISTSVTSFQLLLLIVFSLYSFSAGAQKSVRQIEIHSGWGGLGSAQNADVIIRKDKSTFVRDGKRVDTALVQALVDALEAPHIAKPEMANLGITPGWLKEHLATVHPHAFVQGTPTTENQKALFAVSFTDTELIAKVIPRVFSYWKTDDYPYVKVEVSFEDGSKITVQSNSNYVYMLPWTFDEKEDKDYNADISRAVSALLPLKTVNKVRLTGEELPEQLTDAVMGSIETEWNLRGADDLVSDALKVLRQSYEVVATEIGPWHHPEYGTATYKGEPEEMNLHATLHKSTFPANLTNALVLREVKKKVEGIDEFLKTGSKYEALPLSIPWLSQYIQDNPKIPVRISYVQGLSFGNKAMRTFAADMKAHGREDLIEPVRAQQAQIVLLITGMRYFESYWLLFPDKHMMLWRYGGPTGLLKWKEEDFPPGQCAEYQSNYGGCSGREVTPDGALAPLHSPRDQECMAKYRSSSPSVQPQTDHLFPVMDHGHGGFIDGTGKVIIPLCFEAVGDFSEGLARFERDKSWGYIDTTGTVIIEPKFPWAEEFSEGLARVQVTGSQLGYDSRWGFIDKTGKVIIAPNYPETYGGKSNIGSDDKGDAFHDGLAKIEIEDKSGPHRSGFIDTTGKVRIPPRFTYAYPFSEGLAAATESPTGGDGWGYIDTTGNWAIAPQFEWGSSFHEGLAPVKRRQNCGYINPKGDFVLQPPMLLEETDCATVWDGFSEGLARWRFGKKYGFIDYAGKTVIQPRFDMADQFSKGLAAVRIGSKWGYIDKTGTMVIKLNDIMSAEPYHHGLAFVRTTDSRYGYIDKAGNYVWKPTFLYVQ